MIDAILTLPKRGTDAWGDGAFGARRGGHTHRGIDYACEPGVVILSPVAGVVTKHGYCYGDDLSYRYIQITSHVYRRHHRLFYVLPSLAVGNAVEVGEDIGEAQDISARYDARMVNHVHYEIKMDGKYINPED